MTQPPKVTLELVVPPADQISPQARQLLEAQGLQPGDFLAVNPSGVVELVRQIHTTPSMLTSALLAGALQPVFGCADDAVTHLNRLAVASGTGDHRSVSAPAPPGGGRVLPFRPRRQEG